MTSAPVPAAIYARRFTTVNPEPPRFMAVSQPVGPTEGAFARANRRFLTGGLGDVRHEFEPLEPG